MASALLSVFVRDDFGSGQAIPCRDLRCRNDGSRGHKTSLSECRFWRFFTGMLQSHSLVDNSLMRCLDTMTFSSSFLSMSKVN